MRALTATYLILLLLLAMTVMASQIDLGTFSLAVSLSIAILKTVCVAWVFMELRSGVLLVRLAAGAALLWLLFFYVLAATDTMLRPMMVGVGVQ